MLILGESPAKREDTMNVIVIINDTVRRDHLGCYGNTWIHTPNLDRLAQDSTVFDRAYIASYPTVPNRWDMAMGRYGFPYRGWEPMDGSDLPLGEILTRNGHFPVLFYDTPMLGIDDFNYTRGYEAFRFVRGQHFDPYATDPGASFRLSAQAHKMSNLEGLKTYFRNTTNRKHEREHMAARTISESIEWLEENHTREQFLLWIDMWDPHEPFDPPWYDWDRYRDPDFSGEQVIYPAYGRPTYMSADEAKAVRALYAGKVTMVDRWVGRLLEKVEQLNLMGDTLIIWTTDHGHLFGEHDLQGKPNGYLGDLYEEITRIPLIIRHPGGLGSGKRVGGLVQPPDLLPTILEFLEIPIPEQVQGESVWPLVTGEKDSIRDAALSARFPVVMDVRTIHDTTRIQGGDFMFDGSAPSRTTDAVTVTTEKMVYICSPMDRPSKLYDLEADPKQQRNIIDVRPEAAKELRQKAIDFIERHGGSPGRIQPFQEASRDTPFALSTKLWGFRDERGLWITYADEARARQIVSWDAPGPKRTLEETTFGRVLDDNPRNLVRLAAPTSFYWAQDLAQ